MYTGSARPELFVIFSAMVAGTAAAGLSTLAISTPATLAAATTVASTRSLMRTTPPQVSPRREGKAPLGRAAASAHPACEPALRSERRGRWNIARRVRALSSIVKPSGDVNAARLSAFRHVGCVGRVARRLARLGWGPSSRRVGVLDG